MGEPIGFSLGTGSNQGRHGQEGIASFENAYAEKLGDGGKVEMPIYAINGWQNFSTLTGGAGVRAALSLDTNLLAVSGRLLFSVTPAGVATVVGGIPTDGFVTMARNRRSPNPQVAIVCDGQWYIYEGGALTQGDDTDLPPPIAVVEIDGYFVFLIADGRWFITEIDGTEIDGLDFTSAQASPDNNVIGGVRGRELVIFGTRSMEFYVDNASNDDFPFSRVQTASIGCYAAGSMAKIIVQNNGNAVDTLIWAATDHKGAFSGVMILSGYSGSRISTSEVDRLIRDEPHPADIRSFAWTEDDHAFYCITGTSFSMVWDSTTGQWHSRKSYGKERWNASCHAQFGQAHIFGHVSDNKLYQSLPALNNEAGSPIRCSITTPPIHMYPHRFRVNGLYLDLLTGVGINSDDAEDVNPQLMLEYSRDGGKSFGAQRLIDLGAEAQRKTRVKERSFGNFDHNGVSFRLSWSANVVKGILQGSIDADKLKA